MDFKKIPIIGDLDFSNPAKRKSSIRVCVAACMLLIVLILIIVQSMRKSSGPDQQQEQNYESVQIPLGQDKDNLEGKTIRDVTSSRRGRSGAYAEDLFVDKSEVVDPLAEISGNNKETDDPLSSLGEDTPDFIKRIAEGNNKDIYPETKGATQKKAPKPQQSTSSAPSTPATNGQGASSSSKTAEERHRELYIKYGIDPDTKEPLPGSPLSAAGQASPASTQPKQEETQKEEDQPVEAEKTRVQVRKSGGVSAFGLGGESSSGSLSSLGEEDMFVNDDPSHPFKVKFAYDEKVSSGQRVTIRLCEDMVIDGVLIPVNTHLFATCQVGERLKLNVSSIDINGKIYSLNYTAYDNDGAEGLYCPQSEASKIAKEAGEQAGQLAQTAISSAITGYPGRIFQSGASIVRSRNGKVTVSVTAGYTFYLIRDK